MFDNNDNILRGGIRKTEIRNNPADILYGDLDSKEKDEKEYRKNLLDILGDMATPANILYATTKELEDKIINSGLGEKLNEIKQIYGAVESFKHNYQDLREANTKNADKYFHAKANCEAAQYGKTGAGVGKILSDIRENTDLIKNKYKKKKNGARMTNEEILADYIEDQDANTYGRLKGLQNPQGECKILINKYRPNGLNDKY